MRTPRRGLMKFGLRPAKARDRGHLEFIMSQLAQVPTRKQLARYSLLVMIGTGCLVQTLAFVFR
jgi:hypothetical protein